MWFTNLKTKYYNFNFICVDWLHTMSLMFYASVSSGVVYGYSHENKKRVYTERDFFNINNESWKCYSNYGSGFCNSHSIKCSRVGLCLLKIVTLLAG